MAEYLAPGVYVEEEDRGPQPIEGVSTSTAGFVGVTRRGSTEDPPELVTSYADFVRKFGGVTERRTLGPLGREWGQSGQLARAVQGFFENGGKRVYIRRVAPSDAAPARLGLRGGLFTRLLAPPMGRRLRLVSMRGVEPAGTLVLSQTVGGVALTATVTIGSIIDAERGEIELTAASPDVSAFQADAASVQVRPQTADPTVELEARDPGEWGRGIRVRLEDITPARTTVGSLFDIPLRPLSTATLPVETPGGGAPAVPVGEVIVDRSGGLTSPAADDRIALEDSDGNVVERIVTNVRVDDPAAARDTLELDTPVDPEFAITGAEVRQLTAARAGTPGEMFLELPLPAGFTFAAGNRITLSGGRGTFRELTVDSFDVATGRIRVADLPDPYLVGAVVRRIAPAVGAGANTIRVQSARAFYPGALIEIVNATGRRRYHTVTARAGDHLALTPATHDAYDEGHEVRLCEQRLHVQYENADDGVRLSETYDFALNPAAGDAKNLRALVDARSSLVRVTSVVPREPFEAPAQATTGTGTWTNLAAGSDGTIFDEDLYVGRDRGPGNRTGIQSLREIDQISIVAVPGIWSQTVQNALVTHCESLMDRFAVLDGPPEATMEAIQSHRNLYDTRYAALYHPWLEIRRTDRTTGAAEDVPIPPSGHVVGIYARSDVERGVWKAPANEVVRGITGLTQTLTKGEQDILNPMNINVIRDFRARGRGYRVWGARCITSDTPWKYVNVRRLFIFIEESLEEGTQWAVFEPNDRPLWARLTQSVSRFLLTQWREGALQGATAEQAFFVRCDETTMTQDDIDNGRLIMIVGIAPVKPAEFVIIRIGQWDGGSSIEELSS